MRVLISGSFNAFEQGWNSCGVYACSGVFSSDSFSQPLYVGSSWNIKSRINKNHLTSLREESHINKPLQFSWTKHGEDNFIWLLLEACKREELLNCEQYYLDYYRPFADERGGFNISHYADSPFKGRRHSEETKLKIRESTKYAMRSFNPIHLLNSETIAKRAKTMRGRKQSPEHRKNKAISAAKYWRFKNPNGETVEIFNLKEFSRINELSEGCMKQVYRDIRGHHKGWSKA